MMSESPVLGDIRALLFRFRPHNLRPLIIEEPIGGIPKVCRGCMAAGNCSPGNVAVCEDNAARAKVRRAAKKLLAETRGSF